MLGSLIIIPNENKLHIEPYPYMYDLKSGENHIPKIKDFSNKYELGITSEMLGVPEDSVNNIEWPRKIASLGHVVITIRYFMVVYLPKTFSKGQNDWFSMNEFFFKEHQKLLAFEQIDENMNILESGEKSFNIDKMYQLIKDNLEIEESSDLKR